MQLPILVFDLETTTDLQAAARLHDLHGLHPEAILQAMQTLRRQESGQEFPRLALHEVVCISGLWIDQQQMHLFSWTRAEDDEAALLQKFIGIFERRHPVLVSWNGSQFDLPVILHRCLVHGISAPRLFDEGQLDRQRRQDNYQNRYQLRHTDLLDVLAHFNGRNLQKLDELAHVLGLPGKVGGDGHQVTAKVLAGQWADLARYCESDVLNTWLIYLRWLLLRGFIDHAAHQHWIEQTVALVRTQPQQSEFLQRWQQLAAQTPFTAQHFAPVHEQVGTVSLAQNQQDT